MLVRPWKQSDTLHLMLGKANLVHRKDVQSAMRKVLCSSCDAQDRVDIRVADSLSMQSLADVISSLSRKRQPYFDQCIVRC